MASRKARPAAREPPTPAGSACADAWSSKLGPDDNEAKQWLAKNTPDWAKQSGYFAATSAERADSTIYGSTTTASSTRNGTVYSAILLRASRAVMRLLRSTAVRSTCLVTRIWPTRCAIRALWSRWSARWRVAKV